MRANRPFTLKERKHIEKLLPRKELSLTEIAAIVGRSKNGVITEVRNNGGRAAYNAILAQSAAIERSETRYENLSARNKGKILRRNDHEQRIEILEMQVEILIEQLEKGKNVH